METGDRLPMLPSQIIAIANRSRLMQIDPIQEPTITGWAVLTGVTLSRVGLRYRWRRPVGYAP